VAPRGFNLRGQAIGNGGACQPELSHRQGDHLRRFLFRKENLPELPFPPPQKSKRVKLDKWAFTYLTSRPNSPLPLVASPPFINRSVFCRPGGVPPAWPPLL